VNVVPPHTWTKRKELVVAVSSATAKRTTRNVEFTLPSRDRLRPLLNGEVRAGMTVESAEPVPDHRGVTRRNSRSGGSGACFRALTDSAICAIVTASVLAPLLGAIDQLGQPPSRRPRTEQRLAAFGGAGPIGDRARSPRVPREA
jgi:hypothetical protein